MDHHSQKRPQQQHITAEGRPDLPLALDDMLVAGHLHPSPTDVDTAPTHVASWRNGFRRDGCAEKGWDDRRAHGRSWEDDPQRDRTWSRGTQGGARGPTGRGSGRHSLCVGEGRPVPLAVVESGLVADLYRFHRTLSPQLIDSIKAGYRANPQRFSLSSYLAAAELQQASPQAWDHPRFRVGHFRCDAGAPLSSERCFAEVLGMPLSEMLCPWFVPGETAMSITDWRAARSRVARAVERAILLLAGRDPWPEGASVGKEDFAQRNFPHLLIVLETIDQVLATGEEDQYTLFYRN